MTPSDPQIPVTLQQALHSLIQLRRNQGKISTYKKLEAVQAKAEEYLQGQPLPLADLNAQWITAFARWLTDTKHRSANTRATYLRSLHTVCRRAQRLGATVDLQAFPKEYRANTPAAPTSEAKTEAGAISHSSEAQSPAAAPDPRSHLWFAMRCRSVDPEEMERQIRSDYPRAVTYRPIDRPGLKPRRGQRQQPIDILRDILFFRPTQRTARLMKYAYHDRAYIYDYRSGDTRELAIVSANDLRAFMYLHETAPDRILYYFPGETQTPRPEAGRKARVAEGPFKDTEVTVAGTNPANPLEAIVTITFTQLGLTTTAPIPWRFLTSTP